ncbi:MAG: hypothetical protein NC250_04535 [Alistipes senegalensis]|nr:hypothetical protein [Bacteroides cellulosilyticus]MCM1351978.1 hypothetical protein [Alistipes senegalensis]
MKRIGMLVFLLAATVTTLRAQEHILRVGVGMAMETDYDYNSRFGPLLSAEYQWDFSRYVALQSRLSFASVRIDPVRMNTMASGAVGVLVTPLPKLFRYIKVGANVQYVYHRYTYQKDDRFVYEKCGDVGFGFPIRAFIIDNPKYELSVGYDLLTEFQKGNFLYVTDYAALYFGVKF